MQSEHLLVSWRIAKNIVKMDASRSSVNQKQIFIVNSWLLLIIIYSPLLMEMCNLLIYRFCSFDGANENVWHVLVRFSILKNSHLISFDFYWLLQSMRQLYFGFESLISFIYRNKSIQCFFRRYNHTPPLHRLDSSRTRTLSLVLIPYFTR